MTIESPILATVPWISKAVSLILECLRMTKAQIACNQAKRSARNAGAWILISRAIQLHGPSPFEVQGKTEGGRQQRRAQSRLTTLPGQRLNRFNAGENCFFRRK